MLPPSITITRSKEEQAELYNKVVNSVVREQKYLAVTEDFSLETTKNFLKVMCENNLPQYVLIENNIIIGWCDIIPKIMTGYKHVGSFGMGLAQEFRGKGYGKILAEKTLHHAKEITKLEKVELVVFESNINACKLYKKLGFFEEGKKIKTRKINGQYDNEILMGKFL
jgi:RimJ/RimL family protein N-acetyltransferase